MRSPLPPAGSWGDWEHLAVTDASARGIARLAKDAESGHGVIITRHGRPVAAIVPLEQAGGPAARRSPAAERRQRPAADPGVSATQRWVQAVTGHPRAVPGPPAGV